MANIYTKSGAGNVSPFVSWAYGAATLSGAAGVDAAGDQINVSQAHSESSASSQTIALAGTAANPTKVLCVNDAAEPPTTLSTGAVVQTTGSTSISVTGSGYINGIQFTAGSGTGSSYINLGNTANGFENQFYENCVLELGTSGSASAITSGVANQTVANKNTFKNCAFKFGGDTGQTIAIVAWTEIYGGTIERATFSGASARVFRPFGSSGEGCGGLVSGTDMSGLGSAFNICQFVGATTSNNGLFSLIDIKLPDGWAGSLVDTPITSPGVRVQMRNAKAGLLTYRFWSEDIGGSVRDENTVVRTDGARDGAAYSLKMSSSASVVFPSVTLDTPEFAKYNTSTSAITATVEIVTDSATALKDDEIWLEVSYPGASGQAIVTDAKASILATAADQASSSVDWTTTGLSTPLKQKLSVTFTPAAAGWLQAKVKLAKPSTTVYVDPMLTVA